MPERVDLDRIREYRSHGYIEVAIPSIDARLKAVEEEAFRLKDELAKRDWISVTYRLPKKNTYVLWATIDRGTVEGYYEPWPNGMQFWRETRTPSVPRSLTEVTHWMQLPEPPKKETL